MEFLKLVAENAVQAGDLEGAVAAHAQIIELRPMDALAHYKYGNLLKDLGRLEPALAQYDRAIALNPACAFALCNRGVVLERLERLTDALASYASAIALDPSDALSHYNHGSALRALGRLDEALESFDAAIALAPNYAEAHCNRGNVLKELKRWDAALASYDRSIEIHPGQSLAYFNRGTLHQELSNRVQSLADYDKAIELDLGCADAHCNRGVLLGQLKRPDEGLASIDRAIALAPGLVSAHFSRAEALMSMKRFEAAVVSYDRALQLKRTEPFLLGSRRFAKMILCDWDHIDSEVAELAAGLERDLPVAAPFHIVALVDDAGLQHQAARIWTRRLCASRPATPVMESPTKHAKIHLGYFSADFREHPVSLLMAEVFESHDRSNFELTAFSFGPDTQDPLRKRIERSFDRFVDVRGMTDAEVSALARKLSVDVAIDLGGHTAEARTNVFALRAAPIQVNYLGYPGTMGADYIDYVIADPTVIPPWLSDHYTEKIIHLPHSFLPNDSTRQIADLVQTRDQVGLPADAFVFCCFNNSYKITPGVFDTWMKILARVENGVLWLSEHHPTAMSNLRREASHRGIDPARMVFAARASAQPEYLARLRLGDLFLDTLPYNAHTTAIDALWAGLPVLTRIGQSFAGRVAASLLSTIGLPELITATAEEYQELAVALAGNPARLAAIRQRLLENRSNTPLFDTALLTRQLESAYRRIHGRRLAGLPPTHDFLETDRSDACFLAGFTPDPMHG